MLRHEKTNEYIHQAEQQPTTSFKAEANSNPISIEPTSLTDKLVPLFFVTNDIEKGTRGRKM